VTLTGRRGPLAAAAAAGLVARFDSYGDPRIAEVGRELDAKLAALIEALGAELPRELQANQGFPSGRRPRTTDRA